MAETNKPLLHLVFGGEVVDPRGTDFVDADKLHIVGLFPNYASALKAWKGASLSQVDNANYKYVIVHLHRLMDPDHPEPTPKKRAVAKKPPATKTASRRRK